MAFGRLAVVVGIAVIWACSRPATSGGPVAPEQRQPPSDLRKFVADWARVPDGKAPADWVDVQDDDDAQFSWIYDGEWHVRRDGLPRLVVPNANTALPEPLTFRRYDGGAFGRSGELPERYRVILEGRSLGGAARFNGYGELASQVFYLSPVSYVEVLQTDNAFSFWQADNAPPMQGAGWQQLGKVPNRVRQGEWVRFGAEVDTRAGTLTAFLGDRAVATMSPSLMASGAEPKLTLRATGNRAEWRVVEIHELP